MINDYNIKKYLLIGRNQETETYAKEFNLSTDEVNTYFEQYNLSNANERRILRLKIQACIEEMMLTEDAYDDLDGIVSSVVVHWNSLENIKLSFDLVQEVLMHTYKSADIRKALGEFAEGEVDNFKFYNKRASDFLELVVRGVLLYSSTVLFKHGEYLAVARALYEPHFGNLPKKQYYEVIGEIGLLNSRGAINFPKLQSVSEIFLVDKSPILVGVKRMIKTVVDKNPLLLEDEKVGRFFKHVLGIKMHKDEEKFEQQEVTPLILETVKPLQQYEEVKELSPVIAEIDAVIEQLEKVKKIATMQVTEQVDNKNIENRLEQYQIQLATAEDTISRLKNGVQQERERANKARLQSLKQFVDSLGGSRNGYLLSDLYRESEGTSGLPPEIVKGQLSNLFTILNEKFQIMVFGNEHQVGDKFVISRDELAHQYNTLNPIETVGDEIHVQLKQYGWKIEGQILVQPLIEEIKGGN